MRLGHSLAAALPFCVVIAGCGETVIEPRPQWTITLSTDAPVPQFGDRLLVQLIDEQGAVCDGCRRLFDVASPEDWPLSFGVLPPEDEGPIRAHAALYRSVATGADGSPGSEAHIEVAAELPVPTTAIEVSMRLPMSCFGVGAAVEDGLSCDPETGGSAPIRVLPVDAAALSVGSWQPAQAVDCPVQPPAGMVCVPGGAFLIGRPGATGLTPHLHVPERLVQLSPYALDRDEMTVGEARALVIEHGLAELVGQGPVGTLEQFCTYLAVGNDPLPLNCVSPGRAAELCAVQGKRLPSEAEWEFAAGNRVAETRYPWGEHGEPCDRAHVGHGYVTPDFVGESSACLGSDPPGIRAGGSEADVTELGIRNLGGSLSEWIGDGLVDYASGCWAASSPLLDPRCDVLDVQAVRGGSWGSHAFRTWAVTRQSHATNVYDLNVGLRCAVDFR